VNPAPCCGGSGVNSAIHAALVVVVYRNGQVDSSMGGEHSRVIDSPLATPPASDLPADDD